MLTELAFNLQRQWSLSKGFRIALALATIWVILRLTFQLMFASGQFSEVLGIDDLPYDLPLYLKAANSFSLHQGLYPEDLRDSGDHNPNSPLFVMLSTVILLFPVHWVSFVGSILTVAAYILIYLKWIKIFHRSALGQVNEKMVFALPVWLIYSAFWGWLAYLNVGVIVVLIVTLLIEAILEERLDWAALWLTLLLISKIMWAFPVALPLLLGRHQFFIRLVLLAVLGYAFLFGIAMLVTSPGYIIQEYDQYFRHLRRLGTDFPWNVVTNGPYLGYNHSIKHVTIFLLGKQPWVLWLATAIKLTLLLPLALIGWRFLRSQPAPNLNKVRPNMLFDLVFALYLGAFIWLDIVWEVMLGIVVFSYLLATLEQSWQKRLIWIVVLPYAFIDVIQFVSYAIAPDALVNMSNLSVVSDPSAYLPLTMIVILTFYSLLIKRLLKSTSQSVQPDSAPT